jgi:coatomer subunit beta'
VAGTKCGFIHVYSYDKMKRITSFRDNCTGKNVISLAIHPTQSYMLSVSKDCSLHQIKLWDWNRGWECTQTFMNDDCDSTVVFNPMDITIASSSMDIVKVGVLSVANNFL